VCVCVCASEQGSSFSVYANRVFLPEESAVGEWLQSLPLVRCAVAYWKVKSASVQESPFLTALSCLITAVIGMTS
jgi:hypothetical protein